MCKNLVIHKKVQRQEIGPPLFLLSPWGVVTAGKFQGKDPGVQGAIDCCWAPIQALAVRALCLLLFHVAYLILACAFLTPYAGLCSCWTVVTRIPPVSLLFSKLFSILST